MTGDEITINASDAGLEYLRKDTYFEWVGVGRYKIPTNCCNNPIDRISSHSKSLDGRMAKEIRSINFKQRSIDNSDRNIDEELEENMIKQYPNPTAHNATFEFSVIEIKL